MGTCGVVLQVYVMELVRRYGSPHSVSHCDCNSDCLVHLYLG